ncbi:GAD-like domain-containing protein [Deinococcus sp.]|uniref:GAD-like domain-containing protein n=1 Tax=Deinococcus sp. TaxID=47478 RepID=UPI003C7DC84E
MTTGDLRRFTETHPPAPGVREAPPELLVAYRGRLPGGLLQLWEEDGLGWYGDGLIQLIDPRDYASLLSGWLMQDEPDPSRTPVALSAFGQILYHRALGEGAEDFSLLDPHGRSVQVLAWSLTATFNELLCDPSATETLLGAPLQRQAAQKLGPLAEDESYFFVPALALGGARELRFVQKGNALVHLTFLLDLTRA